jgi:hypothetical protein
MSRKLIERARARNATETRNGYRRHRDRIELELDEDGNLDEVQEYRRVKSSRGPQRQMSIGRGSKSLTDKLNPLIRFLRSNVGRPWDKVYGEIRAHIGTNSTLDMHILEHLDWFVDVTPPPSGPRGLFRFKGDFRVDVHGILREGDDTYAAWKLARKNRPRRPAHSIRLSDRSFHLKKAGIWYLVTYDKPVENKDFSGWYYDYRNFRRVDEPTRFGDPEHYQVKRRVFCRERDVYVDNPQYARSTKTQLNTRALRSAGLTNDYPSV